VEWFIPVPPQILQYAGQRRGREGVAQFFSLLDGAEEIERFEPKEFLAQGEKVVVLGTYRARVKTTGRIVESDWVHVHILRDAKVQEFREFCDTAAAVEAYRAEKPRSAAL
jgi:ketosteroid isomerase-like protein